MKRKKEKDKKRRNIGGLYCHGTVEIITDKEESIEVRKILKKYGVNFTNTNSGNRVHFNFFYNGSIHNLYDILYPIGRKYSDVQWGFKVFSSYSLKKRKVKIL